MNPEQIERLFAAAGGETIATAQEFAARTRSLCGMIFDWDGVFNRGVKSPQHASGFAEPDSMGTNLLRYGLWRFGRRMPVAAIISGEDNPAARQFAEREHFQAVYFRSLDKRLAVEHLCAAHDLTPDRLLCVGDDVNDLAMASVCGLRCWVRRPAAPLLQAYLKERGLADYITAAGSGSHPVREVAELILGMAGLFDAVVDSRMALDADYRRFLAARQTLRTRYYYQENHRVVMEDSEKASR